jgi:hypothetical protein
MDGRKNSKLNSFKEHKIFLNANTFLSKDKAFKILTSSMLDKNNP